MRGPRRRQRELFRDPGRERIRGLSAPAGGGQTGAQLAALLPHGDLGFHRGADLGAAVCDGPNPPHRAGLGGREGERPAGPPHPQAVPGAGQVLPAAGNHRWAGVRHPDRAAHGPVQHLAELHHLCEALGVEARRVFPHNFRHLFARAFYALEKDIAKLADLFRATPAWRDNTNLYHGERRRA